jgi:hypothetical protein
MKKFFLLISTVLVLASSGFASPTITPVQNGSDDLVQALLAVGYRTSPPTPAGVSLDADEVHCYQTDFGPISHTVHCEIKEAESERTLDATGERAEAILKSLQRLGVQGVVSNPETIEVSVKKLRCYYDTLPRPGQPYNPSWNCEFDR